MKDLYDVQTYDLKTRVDIWTRMDMVPGEYGIFAQTFHLTMWLFQIINGITIKWYYERIFDQMGVMYSTTFSLVKIVTVCLLFTIYLIIESNENSFPSVLTFSKTYALNLTRTKQI